MNTGVLDTFSDMKTNHTKELLVLYINANNTKVLIDENLSQESCTNSELYTFFESHESDTYFVIHDFVTDAENNFKKLIFVKW